MFYSNTRKPPRRSVTFENKEQDVYKVVIDKKTGKRHREVVDKINFYDKIQEYAEEVKIQNIMKKYDVNLHEQMKKDEGEIVDLTNMPENLVEVLNTMRNAEYLWERQSKELKAKFNNDFNQFIAGSENGKLAEILNKEIQTKAEKFKQITPEQKQTMITREQTVQINNGTLPGQINNGTLPGQMEMQQTNQITQQMTQQGGNTNV